MTGRARALRQGWVVRGRVGCGLTAALAMLALAADHPAAEEARPAETRPRIVVATIDPARAAQALKDGLAALDAKDWVKAGGLLEAVAQLDGRWASDDQRRSANAALVTSYLQLGDADGAARSLGRRAALEPDEKQKQRFLAAAEAVKECGQKIGSTEVRTCDEAVAAGVEWKVKTLVETAKKIASEGRLFSVKERLERTAQQALDKLKEADVLSPGTLDRRRKEVLGAIVNHLLERARWAIDTLGKEREWLSKNRSASLMNKQVARPWSERVAAYLAMRQDTEDALRNLDPFARKFQVGDLYDDAEVQRMLEKLEDYQFYPTGDAQHRLRILPRKTGGRG